MRNAIPVSALSEYVNELKENPEEGIVKYGVDVNWQSGTRAKASALPMEIGPHRVNRDFSWIIDEPRQLLGTNHAPNPQEYLMSGMGACIMVGFVVGASIMGVQLEHLRVRIKGQLDLAGFLDVREDADIPFTEINYDIEVAGDGTAEQFEELRQQAVKHSPNAMTIANNVEVNGTLNIIEC